MPSYFGKVNIKVAKTFLSVWLFAKMRKLYKVHVYDDMCDLHILILIYEDSDVHICVLVYDLIYEHFFQRDT